MRSLGYHWRMHKWRRYWKRREATLHAEWAHWLVDSGGSNPWPL